MNMNINKDNTPKSPQQNGLTPDNANNDKKDESMCNIPNNPNNPNNPKPTTIPAARLEKLQQMLWYSLNEARGEIVAVTKTNGDTYSGILYAIQPSEGNTFVNNNPSSPKQEGEKNNNNDLNIAGNGDLINASWEYIVLKYVQKMENPNDEPSKRIRAPFEEEIKIPANEFAALSAINIADHNNSYRRADRDAFNDRTGRKLRRKERELVRWDATANGNDDEGMNGLLENEKDLENLDNDYNQFEANQIDEEFDESMYTSKLDTTDPEYIKNLKDAEQAESRIMAQATTSKHVLDDRAYYLNKKGGKNKRDRDRQSGDIDEEDRFARVLHDASMSKQNLKSNKNNNNNNGNNNNGNNNSNNNNGSLKKKKSGGYIPPHLRVDNENGNGRKNQVKFLVWHFENKLVLFCF